MVEARPVAELVEEVLEEKIGDYFSRYLAGREREYEHIGMLERLIRLEEELKAQRELMKARFEAIDRRFEAIDRRFEAIDRRFEAIDRRFEDLIHYMDRRFEDINRRFSLLTWLISGLFGALALLITVFKFVG